MPKKLTTDDLAVPLTLGDWDWREGHCPWAGRPVCCGRAAQGLFVDLPRRFGAQVVLHLTQKWPGKNYAVLLGYNARRTTLHVNGVEYGVFWSRLRELVSEFEDNWCYAWVELPA